MRKLRENLAEGYIVVWMDFAENYICSSMDEVQSAYWNANMVTLHTQVVYFPASHNKNHMSVVGISEVIAHNATSVNAMIKKLLSIIKDEYPGTHTIHYLTDSPTSQYRNKTIFNLICAHSELCGCKIHLWRHSIVLALHYFQGMACYRSATLLEVMDTISFWNMFCFF